MPTFNFTGGARGDELYWRLQSLYKHLIAQHLPENPQDIQEMKMGFVAELNDLVVNQDANVAARTAEIIAEKSGQMDRFIHEISTAKAELEVEISEIRAQKKASIEQRVDDKVQKKLAEMGHEMLTADDADSKKSRRGAQAAQATEDMQQLIKQLRKTAKVEAQAEAKAEYQQETSALRAKLGHYNKLVGLNLQDPDDIKIINQVIESRAQEQAQAEISDKIAKTQSKIYACDSVAHTRDNLENDDYKITYRRLHALHTLWPEKFKDLYVTATVARSEGVHTKGVLQFFSAKDTPDEEIAETVRASSSYPLIYKDVLINGVAYSDGGIKDNLPIRHFVRPHDKPGSKIVFKLTNEAEVDLDVTSQRIERGMGAHIENVAVRALFGANPIRSEHKMGDVVQRMDDRVILCPVNYGTLETTKFHATTEEKEAGVRLGQESTGNALDRADLQLSMNYPQDYAQTDRSRPIKVG